MAFAKAPQFVSPSTSGPGPATYKIAATPSLVMCGLGFPSFCCFLKDVLFVNFALRVFEAAFVYRCIGSVEDSDNFDWVCSMRLHGCLAGFRHRFKS